ncbi:MAG: hypothetical protein KF889_17960 [Alphaproteobacteria bacterium]|nr:hypothetical protein [Alphaproteobacteria bacterium]MCW5741339.1 hypothetical protein [Alphaproteobacteria bacterium]
MKTLSHVYASYSAANDTVRDLEAAGIPTVDISIIASKEVARGHAEVTELPGSPTGTGAGIGAAAGGTAGLLAGIGLLAIPGLGPVVAAGWLAAAAVGAVAGGAAGAGVGGLVSALRDTGIPPEHAHEYTEAVRRGGTLVTARVPDSQWDMACAIMERHGPIDPSLRGDAYREDGWDYRGDPRRDPARASESQIDRIRGSGYL